MYSLFYVGPNKYGMKWKLVIIMLINLDKSNGTMNLKRKMGKYKIITLSMMRIQMSNGMDQIQSIREYQISDLLIILSLMLGTLAIARASIWKGLMQLVTGNLYEWYLWIEVYFEAHNCSCLLLLQFQYLPHYSSLLHCFILK